MTRVELIRAVARHDAAIWVVRGGQPGSESLAWAEGQYQAAAVLIRADAEEVLSLRPVYRDAFEAEVLVATRDVPLLKIDQEAELSIDGLPDRKVTAKVRRISPVANAGTRFVPVFLHLSNFDGHSHSCLGPGSMRATVRITPSRSTWRTRML